MDDVAVTADSPTAAETSAARRRASLAKTGHGVTLLLRGIARPLH